MLTGYWSYHGDDFDMYRYIESLCCIPGTSIALTVIYN